MVHDHKEKIFIYRKDAFGIKKYLVPNEASKAKVVKDTNGWKLQVWWHSGEVTNLTVGQFAKRWMNRNDI